MKDRLKPCKLQHSQVTWCVTHREHWGVIKTGCKPTLNQFNSIIENNETILVTVPQYDEYDCPDVCNIPPADYLQTPQPICPRCFERVDDVHEHLLQKHTTTNILCNHSSHGDQIFYFKNEFEKLQYDRTFHFLDQHSTQAKNGFSHTVSDAFPALISTCKKTGN